MPYFSRSLKAFGNDQFSIRVNPTDPNRLQIQPTNLAGSGMNYLPKSASYWDANNNKTTVNVDFTAAFNIVDNEAKVGALLIIEQDNDDPEYFPDQANFSPAEWLDWDEVFSTTVDVEGNAVTPLAISDTLVVTFACFDERQYEWDVFFGFKPK